VATDNSLKSDKADADSSPDRSRAGELSSDRELSGADIAKAVVPTRDVVPVSMPAKAISSIPPIDYGSSLLHEPHRPLKDMNDASPEHLILYKPAIPRVPTEPVPHKPTLQPVIEPIESPVPTAPHKPAGVVPTIPPEPAALVPIIDPVTPISHIDPVNSDSDSAVPHIDTGSSLLRKPLQPLNEVSNANPFATPIETGSSLGDPSDDKTEVETPEAEDPGSDSEVPNIEKEAASSPVGKENTMVTKSKKGAKDRRPPTKSSKTAKRERDGKDDGPAPTKCKIAEKDDSPATKKRERAGKDDSPVTAKRSKARKDEPSSKIEPEADPSLGRGKRVRVPNVHLS
jgi:hypothetical protein